MIARPPSGARPLSEQLHLAYSRRPAFAPLLIRTLMSGRQQTVLSSSPGQKPASDAGDAHSSPTTPRERVRMAPALGDLSLTPGSPEVRIR